MVLAIMILCVPLLSCVKDEEDPAIAAMKAEITTLKNTITTTNNNVASLQTGVTEAKNNATAALNKANQVSTPDLSTYSTKVTVPQNLIDNLTQVQIDTLKVKLGITTSSSSGTQTPSNPTGVTGQVSIAIINAQQWNTFNPSGIVALKIINNKSEARYVRPQITLNVFPVNSAAAVLGLTGNSCVVSSNSQGQPILNFTATPVSAWTSASQILFIPVSGGMNNAGQYLLSSGTSMDIYLTITLTGGYAGLWTISVSETDVSMATGT
jgi:hypothetical protein